MLKSLSTMSCWLVVFLLQLGAQEYAFAEVSDHSSRQSLFIAPEDLFIHQGGISVDVGGTSYDVLALNRVGDQWLATVDNGVNYCPKGHPTCKGCGQCHNPSCWYYISPCKLW
jgi:hypothetical protein